MKQITEITKQGLQYIDETGQTLFIDFDACYRNQYRHRMEQADVWQDVVRLFNWAMHGYKEVAKRNSQDSPPYIEFHTQPPTVIEFKTSDEFFECVFAIHSVGWSMYDMT